MLHFTLRIVLLTALCASFPPARAAEPIVWSGKQKQTIEKIRIAADDSIRLVKCADITIADCELRSITLVECQRITIRHCWLRDSQRIAVDLYKCRDVRVEGCRIENVVNGLYALESQGVQFVDNFCRNVRGPYPRGQMVQFNNVSGPGNLIARNVALNERGKSCPEDVINIYQSAGTADAPIVIERNYLLGDPKDGSEGKSPTGSGIMLGDCGGANTVCRDNVIVSAGQVGLGVAGGENIRVERNRIVGTRSNVSNVGLYVWNQSGKPSGRIVILNNRVHWINKAGQPSDWWNGGGCTTVTVGNNRWADPDLTRELPAPPLTSLPWPQPGDGGFTPR